LPVKDFTPTYLPRDLRLSAAPHRPSHGLADAAAAMKTPPELGSGGVHLFGIGLA